ncbi:hypothetical protein AB0H83_14270 [Dactylosporangium sp. NPDC050688]|uniref:hypothetical protein n=1 Tax=Dactylosporangium sp. NPDC050688 TaxID=3157217 RepID=UPI0033F9C019
MEHRWEAAPPRLPKGATAEVVEALLPMHLWRAPVLRLVTHGLSVVERFIIEAAVELRALTAQDVGAVTGLPTEITARVIAQLTAAGILSVRPDGAAEPVFPAATDTLERAELYELRETWLTFAYLPRTADLIAFDGGPGTAAAPQLNRLAPAFEAPMPADVAGRPAAEFLDERIRTGTVTGMPEWLHAAVADGATLPATCPAYRCVGHLRRGQPPKLRLVDAKRPERAQPLPVADAATGLAEWLAMLGDAVDGAFDRWGRLARESPNGPHRTFAIGADLARAVMHDGLPLNRPCGLMVRDEEAVVTQPVGLTPADPAAEAVFTLDHAVASVLAEPLDGLGLHTLATAGALAAAAYGAEPEAEDIRAELWRRRHFVHVYRLRAANDFAYD